MKLAVFLGLLWLCWLSASGAPEALPRFPLAGTDYVLLEDWAQANRLQLRWSVPKQQVKASGTWSSFSFDIDSRKINYNGVSLWLSHPVGLRTGGACIAWRDVTSVLYPLLHPSRNPPGKKVEVVCLDPGHGGKDTGNYQGSNAEKKYTLLLAKEINALLSKAGIKVQMTRSRDSFVDLPERAQFAAQKKADLFVSLHFNSADSSVRGAELYCVTPANASSTNDRENHEKGPCPGNRFEAKSLVLAYHLQRSILKGVAAEDRGVRRARFLVLSQSEMPAVLIEGGFMSHPIESQKIYDAAWRRELARAIVQGILAYKKIVET